MRTTILALCMSVLIGLVISCGGGGSGMPDSGNGSGTFESDDTPDQTPEVGTEPVAVIEADTLSGEAPLEVVFSGSQSYDPDGDTLTFFWDFGDESDSTEENPSPHVFHDGGLFTVTLIVEDSSGMTGVSTVNIEVLPDDGVYVDEEEGVVAGLTLDENIDENSPAVIVGDAQWVDGIEGSGMEFDAEGEYILLPDSDNLDLTSEGTVEVWVYPYSNITAAGIVHKGEELDYSDESYSLQYNQAGQVALILTNEAGLHTYVISNEQILSVYTWHHIVAAWDLNEVYLYVDGALVIDRKIYANGWRSDLPSGFAPARHSEGGLMIGSQIPFNLRFDGIIDNVVLYNRVLEAGKVEKHYNSLAP
jgi:PKD repeat protein